MDDSSNNNDNDIMNMSRFDDGDDEDSKLDINSVLSGNVEEEDEEGSCDNYDDNNQMLEGVFGKNLGAIFDDNVNKVEPFAGAVQHDKKSAPTSSSNNNNNNPSRPPLAPGRSVSSSITNKSVNNDSNSSSNGGLAINRSKQQQLTFTTDESKRLSVFLRIRPPVGAQQANSKKKGDNDNEGGSINTIEVIKNNVDVSKSAPGSSSLPTTIRTYPPLNSNAAKVVRGNSASSSSKPNPTSKSLIDDDTNNCLLDPNTEVRGVKEYSYSGVFGPQSSQADIYNNIAAPLVEGLFPQSNNREGGEVGANNLGESALLFTLGVTNAGKTHTVMGRTGFESKSNKKRMEKNNDYTPNEDWGIIPRTVDHMLSRVNSLNKEASGSGGQHLQMYMR